MLTNLIALILNSTLAFAFTIGGSGDPDIIRARHQVGLSDQNASRHYEEWADSNGNTWQIQKITPDYPNNDYVFFLPHDDEEEASDVALSYVKNGVGTVVAIHCAEKRYCHGGKIDPNRYFKTSDYADKMFSYYRGKDTVIALHNNRDGGKYTHVFKKGTKNYKWQLKKGMVSYYHGGDGDDYVLLIGKSKWPTGKNKEMLEHLKKNRINVIYERYSGKNDGSMSFAAYRRGKFYVNIEAQHGHLAQQQRMMRTVLQFLESKKEQQCHDCLMVEGEDTPAAS